MSASTCIFHPSKQAETQCKRCKKYMCRADSKVLVSQNAFSDGPHYTYNRTVYCLLCLPHQLESDARKVKIVMGPLLVLSILIFLFTLDVFITDSRNTLFLPLILLVFISIFYYFYREKPQMKRKIQKAREDAMRFSKTIELEEIKQLYRF